MSGKVTYRSPDALQNLRIRVALTRVSAPRPDRALEMERRLEESQNAARFGSEREANAASAEATAATALGPSASASELAAADAMEAAAAANAGGGGARGAKPSLAPAPSFKIGTDYEAQRDAAAAGAPRTDADDGGVVTAFDPYATEEGGGGGGGAPGPGPVTEGKGGAEDAESLAARFARQTTLTRGPIAPDDPDAPIRFERIVAWQEKVFGAVEIDRIKSKGAPETELERRYSRMIDEGNLTGEAIYTYASADPFADDRDAAKTVTTSAFEPLNGLFRKIFGAPAERRGEDPKGRGVASLCAKKPSPELARSAARKRAENARAASRRRRRGQGGSSAPISTFAICADCGPLELPPSHPVFDGPDGKNAEREALVMLVEAFDDGSIAFTPDFTKENEPIRIERRDGSVFEVVVTNASERGESALEKRQNDIAPTAALRRLELMKRRGVGGFVPAPGPNPGAMRLVLLGEIVSGRGFERDDLYCEWVLDADPVIWKLSGSVAGKGGDDAGRNAPVVTAGVTQICRCTTYPNTRDGEGDGAFSGDRRVAHWSFPFELELVAQSEPEPDQFPSLFFQVSSYDQWDRYRCEGYGYLPLHSVPIGSVEHKVMTWRAGGAIVDRMKEHFVGGTPELGDLAYAGTPRDAKAGAKSAVHSRLGFVADSSGEIKVRTHVATQTKEDLSGGAKRGFGLLRAMTTRDGQGGGEGEGGGDAASHPSESAATRERRARSQLDVGNVIERARARLAEARAQGRLHPDAAPRAVLLSRGAGENADPNAADGHGSGSLARASYDRDRDRVSRAAASRGEREERERERAPPASRRDRVVATPPRAAARAPRPATPPEATFVDDALRRVADREVAPAASVDDASGGRRPVTESVDVDDVIERAKARIAARR
jgi:Meckel syndrome type 1 protein